MFSFPLAYALIPFGIIFLFVALFFFFNLFHIRRYAIESRATTLLVLLYIGCFGTIVLGVSLYILSIDWEQRFEPQDLLPNISNSRLLD